MSHPWQGRIQFVPLPLETKPTLLSLRRTYDIPAQTLADAAGVSVTDLYVMEIGARIPHAFAVRVLNAFSELTGKEYRMDDISVRVKPERVHQKQQKRPVSPSQEGRREERQRYDVEQTLLKEGGDTTWRQEL